MLLYGSTDSGHSYKVRLFLLLNQLPHRYDWINLALPRSERPWPFQRASRHGEVPVLVDEGRALCQSNAILMHLAAKTGRLQGQEGEWHELVEWLCWEANRVGFSVPNLRYARVWAPQPPQVMAYLHDRASADLAALDQFLEARQFLLPSGPTIADLSCSAYLHWLDQAGFAEAAYPNLSAWLGRIRGLPYWCHPDEAMQPQVEPGDTRRALS